MCDRVVAVPGGKFGVGLLLLFQRHIHVGEFRIGVRSEKGTHAVNFSLIQQEGIAHGGPFRLDHFSEFLGAGFLDQNLDARLVLVITPSMEVVDAKDGFKIRQQVFLLQEGADNHANDRSSPQSAAHQNFKADFAFFISDQLQADIVNLCGGTITLRSAHSDLELAR